MKWLQCLLFALSGVSSHFPSNPWMYCCWLSLSWSYHRYCGFPLWLSWSLLVENRFHLERSSQFLNVSTAPLNFFPSSVCVTFNSSSLTCVAHPGCALISLNLLMEMLVMHTSFQCSVINVTGSRRLLNISTLSGFLIFLLTTCLR